MTAPRHSLTTAIRLVLVDDHRMFRSGVKAELDESMLIVGEAGDVDEAIVVVAATRPDVVLLDVHLPGGNGHGGSDVITGSGSVTTGSGEPVRFLALSVSDAAEDVIAVIRAGARGYVTKTIGGQDLTEAIRRVADGDAVFSPRLRWRLHLLRGALGVATMTLFTLGLRSMGLAEAYTLTFVAPLIVTILSVPVLKETVLPRHWIAIGVGLCGVVIALRPDWAGLIALHHGSLDKSVREWVEAGLKSPGSEWCLRTGRCCWGWP